MEKQSVLVKNLISDIKINNSSESLVELFSIFENMFYKISSRILGTFTFELNEFECKKLSILYDAAMSFDEKKNVKFSTWLFNCIKYACLNLSKNSGRKVDMDEGMLYQMIDRRSNSVNSKNLTCALDSIKDILSEYADKNVQKVIKLRYFSNTNKPLNYSDIGKILNITPQTALNWHNKFIKFAKKKLTST